MSNEGAAVCEPIYAATRIYSAHRQWHKEITQELRLNWNIQVCGDADYPVNTVFFLFAAVLSVLCCECVGNGSASALIVRVWLHWIIPHTARWFFAKTKPSLC